MYFTLVLFNWRDKAVHWAYRNESNKKTHICLYNRIMHMNFCMVLIYM